MQVGMLDPGADSLPVFTGRASNLVQAEEMSGCSLKGVESNRNQQFASIQTCFDDILKCSIPGELVGWPCKL